MFRLELKDQYLNEALRDLAEVMTDMTPVMQEIGEYLVTSTKDRFAAGTAPDGTPWAAKSETTLAAYRRRGDRQDSRPLFGPSGALSSQIFAIPGPDAVEWGSNRIYAGVMQSGAAQGEFGAFIGRDRLGRDHFHHLPWGNIPARPFLGLSDADRENILDIIAESITRATTDGD